MRFIIVILVPFLNLKEFGQAIDSSERMRYFNDEVLRWVDSGNENLRLENNNLKLKIQELQDQMASKAINTPKNTPKSSNAIKLNDPKPPKPAPSAQCDEIPKNCDEALQLSGLKKGVHKIRIPCSNIKPFYVYCLADPKGDGGAWTLIQRRIDGSIDFYKPWSDYVLGFGNLEREFFIGLEKLHILTQSSIHELWVQMEDFDNAKRWAKYSSFAIGNASEFYAVTVLGSYTGNAGDSMARVEGRKFTTRDKDNDETINANCAATYKGAWWYRTCYESNLNGKYFNHEKTKQSNLEGIVWKTWRGYRYSLKYVHMAIRA